MISILDELKSLLNQEFSSSNLNGMAKLCRGIPCREYSLLIFVIESVFLRLADQRKGVPLQVDKIAEGDSMLRNTLIKIIDDIKDNKKCSQYLDILINIYGEYYRLNDI